MNLDEAHRVNQRIRIMSSMKRQAEILKAAVDEAVAAEREACAKEALEEADAAKYEREEIIAMIEGIAWSAPTENGEWALREAAKVIVGMIRARKD